VSPRTRSFFVDFFLPSAGDIVPSKPGVRGERVGRERGRGRDKERGEGKRERDRERDRDREREREREGERESKTYGIEWVYEQFGSAYPLHTAGDIVPRTIHRKSICFYYITSIASAA
jgi:hypothetical protein